MNMHTLADTHILYVTLSSSLKSVPRVSAPHTNRPPPLTRASSSPWSTSFRDARTGHERASDAYSVFLAAAAGAALRLPERVVRGGVGGVGGRVADVGGRRLGGRALPGSRGGRCGGVSQRRRR